MGKPDLFDRRLSSAVWPAAAPHPAGQGFYRHRGKRLLDLALVLAALPLVLPVVLVLAAAIWCEGGQPFFGHPRVGRGGQGFRCWKLRTMVVDAEARLQAHLAADPAARAEWAASFKLRDDPRITRFGRFLRRSSLDELPQLWNVLRGEMSLVGPRPVTRAELVLLGGALGERQRLRPGVTGLWQVSGRNDIAYEARVALDLDYVRDHGPGRDLGIILATLRAVLARTGR
ncbi:MAG: sugar transferase [Rubellimicrobium sp.]|nr:sugar transferase [Rubellimicrobium sp.]